MSKSKRKRLLSKRIALFLLTGILSHQMVFANPSGGTAVNGAATIGGTSSNVVVNVLNNGAVINWNKFSINTGETTAFNSALSSYAVLNRVTGSELSTIAGTLSATAGGKIFLVNQNGIVLANGAIINAPLFVASTLNMADADFNSYVSNNFSGLKFDTSNNITINGSVASGAVKVQGNVTGSGGAISLIGNTVAVEPGVTFTNTGGDINLIAAAKASHSEDIGLCYTATKDNKVTITGDSTNGAVHINAADITLAGGAVTCDGLNTTSSRIYLDPAKNLNIYAVNSLSGTVTTESSGSTQTTTQTTTLAADSNNTITMNNTKINNSGNVGTESVSLFGGAVSLKGISDNDKILINNIAGDVDIRALSSMNSTETAVTDGTKTTNTSSANFTAAADNALSMQYGKIIAGTSTDDSKQQSISLMGGKIDLGYTRLEEKGGVGDSVEIIALSSGSMQSDANDTSAWNINAGSDNTTSIKNGINIISPDVSIYGGKVAIENANITVYDELSLGAASILEGTEAKETTVLYNRDTSEKWTATTDNTLLITNSNLNFSYFTNASTNNTYDGFYLNGKLIGGQISLTGTKFNNNLAHLLIYAGNNMNMARTATTYYDAAGNWKEEIKDTTYTGNAAKENTITISDSATNASLITGYDAALLGGAVTITGNSTSPTSNAANNLIVAGNSFTYHQINDSTAALQYNNHAADTSEITGYTGTAGNMIAIGSSTAPVAITGANVTILGGAVDVENSMLKPVEGATAGGSVTIYGIKSMDATGLTAAAANTVILNNSTITTTSSVNDGSDIVIAGGSIRGTGDTFSSASGLELYAVSKVIVKDSSGNVVPITQDLSAGSATMNLDFGNTLSLSDSQLSALHIRGAGNTLTITGSGLTSEGEVSLYAGTQLTNTFTAASEKYSLNAAKDNTLTIGSVGAPVTINGKNITIWGGSADIEGSTANKTALTVSGELNVYAVNSFGSAMEATGDNTLTINNAAISVTGNGSGNADIRLFGGAATISNASFTTAGATNDEYISNLPAITIGAVTSGGKTETASSNGTVTDTFTINTTTDNSVNIASSTFAGPDVSVYGGKVKVTDSTFTLTDYLGIYAGSIKSTETGLSASATEAQKAALPAMANGDKDTTMKVTGSSANTLDISNSTISLGANTSTELIGGKVSLDSISLTSNGYVLIAAGTDTQYASYAATDMHHMQLTSSTANSGNTVTAIGSTLPSGDKISIVYGAPDPTPTPKPTNTPEEILTSSNRAGISEVIQANQTTVKVNLPPATPANSTGTTGSLAGTAGMIDTPVVSSAQNAPSGSISSTHAASATTPGSSTSSNAGSTTTEAAPGVTVTE
ncbi:MAG: filamentous hemagglutinin N-terminal domain-containing protein [Pelosinus sp.]|nr:filamentous hemagglutinin N-terminal domain-containing protein [Pelosinus sp.]